VPNAENHLLIEQLQSGNELAAAELAATYRARIYQLALRYVKNHEDAEEVAQDVLMKIYRSVGSFRGDAALTSWIYRITFNASISHLRRMRARRVGRLLPLDLDHRESDIHAPHEAIADSGEPIDERLVRSQLRRQLASAVRQLPPLYRAPVVLRDIRGLSTEEASAALNVKSQTLKSRLHRGRMILREQLAGLVAGQAFEASQAA
jgi:RNA polymerase sigma-70 factor (ECF subfamily)